MLCHYVGREYADVFHKDVPIEIIAKRFHSYLCRKHLLLGVKPMAVIELERIKEGEIYSSLTPQEIKDNRDLFIWINRRDIVRMEGTGNKAMKSVLTRYED